MPETININKPPQFIQPHMEKGLTAADLVATQPLTGQELGVPTQKGVDPFTQQAEQMAAGQLGLGAFTRDPTTGAVTDVAGAPGVAGYQKYLQGATGAVTAPTSMASNPFSLHHPQKSAHGISPAAPGIRKPIFILSISFIVI